MRLRVSITKAVTSLTMLLGSQHIYAHSYEEAGLRYGIAPDFLEAIAFTESSFREHIESPTNDIGLMGINRSWLPILHKRFGITEADVWQPCMNVHLGAWILSSNYRQYGKNWIAVGAYAAACRKLSKSDCTKARMNYANKVYRNWLKLQKKS